MSAGAARLERAFLLLSQERYDLAEKEARGALADDPDEPFAHGVLALSLACQERYQTATEEAQHAVRLAPDLAFSHYVLGLVMLDRGRLDEASNSAGEAIRLEQDPNHFALLSAVRFAQKRWQDALEAADRGLALDPENTKCVNARGVALMQLGRKEEAHAVLSEALGRDPENAEAHASRGWVYLDQGKTEEAMKSFREALRLDPTLDSARAGIVEALKSRHRIYGLFLRYCLWMSKLSSGKAWLIIIAAYVGYRFLLETAESNPQLAPIIYPLLGVYLFMAILTWTADNLFNLLLRFNRFGRLSLSPEQTRASTVFGASLFMAIILAVVWLITGAEAAALGAIVFGVLIIPITGTFGCRPGWPRMVMGIYTCAVLALGLLSVVFAMLASGTDDAEVRKLFVALSSLSFGPAILGAVLATWIAPALAMIRQRR